MLAYIDLIVFIFYLAVVVAFGCWFVRKSSNSEGFMVAGGSLPGWAVGLSIFGTYLSSNTFLGVPGKAYADNYNAFVFSLSLPFAAWIATKVFVPFYRNHGQISAYEHLEQRFGVWARTYAVVCYLLTQIARMGSILLGVSLGLYALTGWDIATMIVIAGILITFYTLLGGIEAVIWTDVVQSIILMGGAFIVLGLLFWGMPEGPQQSLTLAFEQDKMSLGSWAPDFTTSTVWVVFLFGLFINLGNFGIDQSFVQRYHTAKSSREAAGAVWLGALLYVPISLLFFVIGSNLFAYYQTHPELMAELQAEVAATKGIADAASLTTAQLGDHVLPHFIATQLPTGFAGLLIAAIAAAAMSSIDTSLNSSATVILKDIYQRWFRPDCSENESMWVLRSMTIAVGIIGTGTALALMEVQSILEAWWKLQGIFAGGILGLFLLGIVSRTTSSRAAGIAVAVGLAVIGWMTFSPTMGHWPESFRNPLHENMIIVLGTVTIFVVGILLSFFMKKPAAGSIPAEPTSKSLETN
ncbi:Sodium-dependent multivitamin transporter [Planctomycetales bacterium 10988]|nr:Sodium-dependent multivitamin transporter [Planctomycetales bacterium 10988]